MPSLPPRFSRLPKTPRPWQPTHRLRWMPRAGVAREWMVRVVTNGVGAESVTVAETMEESLAGTCAAWALVAGAWLWKGGGWNGEDGAAVLVSLDRY